MSTLDTVKLLSDSRSVQEHVCDVSFSSPPDELVEQLRSFLRNAPPPERAVSTIRGVFCSQDLLMYQLISCSVQFCFWYGWAKNRPFGAGASHLNDLLSEVFLEHLDVAVSRSWGEYDVIIDDFMHLLMLERFPLMQERRQKLLETFSCSTLLYDSIYGLQRDGTPASPEECFDVLIRLFPGYGEDLFLKRASLFFIQLWRYRALSPLSSDCWEDALKILPVPIDYHIPNVLRLLGLLSYSHRLEKKVRKQDLISYGSRLEFEIRWASCHICYDLMEKAGCNAADLDTWLYGLRDVAARTYPHHLTITSDY